MVTRTIPATILETPHVRVARGPERYHIYWRERLIGDEYRVSDEAYRLLQYACVAMANSLWLTEDVRVGRAPASHEIEVEDTRFHVWRFGREWIFGVRDPRYAKDRLLSGREFGALAQGLAGRLDERSRA